MLLSWEWWTMKPVYIFRHVPWEGPGYLADFLAGAGVPRRLVCIDAGEPVPDSPLGASGLVFMGGPMSVNDPLVWIARETALIRKAVDAGIPVLGHCLGGQLISRALGAAVTRNPHTEIGWHPVERQPGAAADEWLPGVPGSFEAFHWHGETFALPDGAEPLLASEHCARQGYAIGSVLALQCHLEMTAELVTDWVERFAQELAAGGVAVQTAAEIRRDLQRRVAALQRVGDVLYGRWVARLARV
jgi:GMP synthase-like glutamine amidotransferase